MLQYNNMKCKGQISNSRCKAQK